MAVAIACGNTTGFFRMKPSTIRNADYFASLPDALVAEELLKLDIAERFNGDREALTLLYANTKEAWERARSIVIGANPPRHSSVFPPELGEPPIPQPKLSDEPLPMPDMLGSLVSQTKGSR
jgi:hypothetical protein